MKRTRSARGWLIGAMVAVGVGLGGPAGAEEVVIRDVCCFDLDGGGEADDGILVLARGGTEVLMVVIYEDPDRNKKFDAADTVRAVLGPIGTPRR